jgi:RNA polymerase sigma-70 factor, ECF subfamily
VALRQEEFTNLCDDVDLDRDRALVERCQAGDSAAYGNLYARYNERLLRFCLRRLNDRHEAEDAAQEAFARAWKALPNFAGERRFYPWLTVIAGNICTDMLRRRSRSTPTDDLELKLCQPVGSSGEIANDEMLMAAVDGELVHQALNRLSDRHRHVLDLREGSGLTYQQIADQEGVEIGTIETLLWRARQALKREFAVLSESKGAFAGFLVGVGVFARKGLVRLGSRGAALQAAMGPGTVRNAFAGVAATSAAVAAAFVVPHALASPHPPAAVASTAVSQPAKAGGSDGVGPSSVAPPAGTAASGTAAPSGGTPASGVEGPLAGALGLGSSNNTSSSLTSPSVGLPVVGPGGNVPLPTVTGVSGGSGSGLVQSVTSGVGAVASSPGVTTVTQPLTGALSTIGGAAQSVVPGLSGFLSTLVGGSGAGQSTATGPSTAPPVAPGITVPSLPSLAPRGSVTQALTNPLKGLG